MSSDEVVNVRYMVNDVAEAVDFYSTHFGFEVGISSPRSPTSRRGTFASAERTDELGRPPDARRRHARSRRMNRLHFITADLDAEVARLKDAGVHFRNEVVSGPVDARSSCWIRRATSSSCSSPRRLDGQAAGVPVVDERRLRTGHYRAARCGAHLAGGGEGGGNGRHERPSVGSAGSGSVDARSSASAGIGDTAAAGDLSEGICRGLLRGTRPVRRAPRHDAARVRQRVPVHATGAVRRAGTRRSEDARAARRRDRSSHRAGRRGLREPDLARHPQVLGRRGKAALHRTASRARSGRPSRVER